MPQRVRSTQDGQAGFLVEQGGRQWVRIDRGTQVTAEQRLVPYDPEAWKHAESDPLSEMGIARVCYDADRGLRLARGEYGIPEWIALHSKLPEHARSWLAGPPKDADERRVRLFKAVREALADE